jgi:hypothetical protein
MDSMLKPKLPDDPHDILMIAPDAVQVAPTDDAPADPAHLAARPAPELRIHAGPDFSAGAAVPPVDSSFRPTALGDIRPSMGKRALRAFAALLLTAFIGGAAVAWQHHGAAAQRLIAEWAPLFAGSTAQPAEKAVAAQPTLAAAQADTTSVSTPQPAVQPQAAQPQPVAETAPPTTAAAPPPDQTPSIETMARDLANAGQEIEQLKASIEQLKASQQQLMAMVSEKNSAQAVRAKRPPQPAPPPRPVATLAPARKPPPSLSPRQATAAPLQTAPAPYLPRRVEPLSPTTADTLDDPELPYVPRPPMPLR